MLFRFTFFSAAGLVLAVVLGLAGLLMLVGTIDEYRAGRAFDEALDAYAADDVERVHEALDEAIAAQGSYLAPQEVKGKLFIDEGALNPTRYQEAVDLFKLLAESQASLRHPDGHVGPTLPVLVGRAVAQLEASQAQGGRPSARAIAEARRRLERAAEEYPDSGDVYVNLATIALLEDNLPRCRRYLEKVRQVGNISLDALPYLYNLRGLVELREGRLPAAVEEFEKVEEFRPGWSVPRLNLAAAYSQSLIQPDLDPTVANRYAHLVSRIMHELRKERHPLVRPVCHSLAVYHIRTGAAEQALRYLEQAAEQSELGWHERFNRAVATYLAALPMRPDSAQRAEAFSTAETALQETLQNRLATSRDKFVAYALLGTMRAETGQHAEAIELFAQAEALAERTTVEAVRSLLPELQRSLAALYYLTDQPRQAIEYLQKATSPDEPRDKAVALLKQLSAPPDISRFAARFEKAYTNYDIAVSATVAPRATAVPLDPAKDIRLTIRNALTGESRPVPFQLHATDLRALVVNLPQGRFTFHLEVTDHLGNRATAQTAALEIDREPPRFIHRDPAPGSATTSVGTIQFRLHDAISRPDLSTLSVLIRYPSGAAQVLVHNGRYRYPAQDGSVKTNDPITQDVHAPLPRVATVGGTYTIQARAKDSLGKEAEDTWSFVIR